MDLGAVCLAAPRRDGFISLDAGAESGSVTTQPFKLPSAKLRLNAAASRGFVQAALLDANGQVRRQARPMSGDQLRGKVKWKPAAERRFGRSTPVHRAASGFVRIGLSERMHNGRLPKISA